MQFVLHPTTHRPTTASFLRFLEENKLWIILGVVGALLVLTVIQAAVTITRIKKNRSPPVTTKVRTSLEGNLRSQCCLGSDKIMGNGVRLDLIDKITSSGTQWGG